MKISWPGLAVAPLIVVAVSATLCSPPAHAQQTELMPIYTAEQVMQGLYGHFLPAQARTFQEHAEKLAVQTGQYCQRQNKLTELHSQWQQTMVAWEVLSTPAVGPVLTRRSQRQIDFWPTRPALLQKAIAKDPQTLVAMETVGTPAKGLPAVEYLLLAWSKPDRSPTGPAPDSCRFAELVTEGIVAEARVLNADLAALAAHDWQASPEATAAAMSEWVNQWLAAAEKLRWAHIEKPIRAAQGAGVASASEPLPFARLGRDSNLMGWRAQWRSLLAQARLTSEQKLVPPQAGQAAIPVEAILIGKGRLELAKRWTQALDQVSAELNRLTPESSSGALLALAQSLKVVTLLFQNEISPALDIPIGFSDADGD
jgi:predicted lipoprotein